MTIEGSRIFRRGEPGYAEARREATWNARDCGRYPDVIVQARSEADVVAAVRMARDAGQRIGVRSGGHSWNANHIRDGGMLLDVSRLADVEVDQAGMIARAGPGCGGVDLALALARRKLFFPAGHCKGVKIGGYLLQGGYGWHSRELGPACQSVVGIDYVDADGVLRHASESENADMYWAARGAGPGFFGVVTCFHLRLYSRPTVIGFTATVYPASRLEEVIRWAHGVGPAVPTSIELMLILSRHIPAVKGPGILVFAPVFADGYRAAREAVAVLKGRPRGARLHVPFIPFRQAWMYEMVMNHYPVDHCYAVDNMWTRAGADALLPGIARIVETLPSAPSHMLWMNWSPPADRPDMAYSMEDDTYIALYGVWKDEPRGADRWARDNMAEMQHLASGIQLADENLANRPMPFMKPGNMAKLDTLRAEHDPLGRFHPYMGRA